MEDRIINWKYDLKSKILLKAEVTCINCFQWGHFYLYYFVSGYQGLGLASLNLTNIQETDRGWYNCKVRNKDVIYFTKDKG
jgi:hypothetical protein